MVLLFFALLDFRNPPVINMNFMFRNKMMINTRACPFFTDHFFNNSLNIVEKKGVNARAVGLEPTTNGSLHSGFQTAI
jgi:hypothetical protein